VAVAHHSDQLGFRYDLRMQSYAERAAAGASWIFAISRFVRKEVLSLYPGLSPRRVVILENGYNQRIFRPQRVSRARVLRQLGIENDPGLPIITFSGKISRTKGLDFLLRANRWLQAERKVLVLLAGTGRLEDEFSVEERADFHWENVRLLGQLPQTMLAKLHNLAAAILQHVALGGIRHRRPRGDKLRDADRRHPLRPTPPRSWARSCA